MITIIFAPPRTGKTCFMTHVAHETAFDYERNKRMRREIQCKIMGGFGEIRTLPTHCVSANYDMVFHKRRYSPRYSRRINPYRLGFANDFVETHFNLPFERIFITEAQKYLQHGHNDLDVYLDTQRPMLIDVNIRELSQFIEIMRLEFSYNGYGRMDGMRWHIRRIENSSLFDKYMASGKQDKTCYTEDIVTADYNVFDCYDSQCCKPKFYEGHFYSDFDYSIATPTEQTREGYTRYLAENDDELPDGYYQKRGKQVC